jgi:DNA modification methylase
MREAFYADEVVSLYQGDVLEELRKIPDGVVRCCVTSPPYWGLRDYGVEGQIGIEKTPEAYVAKLVAVFAEVRRVLSADGTLWLNLGDCYATGAGKVGDCPGGGEQGERWSGPAIQPNRMPLAGLKPKDLVGIPWRVAFALQADGWYLRSDIIWSKPNPMPESVQDRPTKSHEYVFLLSKSEQYHYDAAAIRTEQSPVSIARRTRARWSGYAPPGQPAHNGDPIRGSDKQRGHSRHHAGFNDRWDVMTKEEQQALGANARSVWTIATQPYPEAHFAVFPEELAGRCILAGSAVGDTVLDPFAGSGTTLLVAKRMQRHAIGVDLSVAYCALAARRLTQGVLPLP